MLVLASCANTNTNDNTKEIKTTFTSKSIESIGDTYNLRANLLSIRVINIDG